MVTRKPVPPSPQVASLAQRPPYPMTPISTNAPPAFHMQDARDQLRSATDSEPDSAQGEFLKGLDRKDGGGLPNSSSETPHHGYIDLPESLKIGLPGYKTENSEEIQRPTSATPKTDLLHEQSVTQGGGISDELESSVAAWDDFPERSSHRSEAQQGYPNLNGTSDIQQFASLSLSEPSTNPWQPALNEKAPPQQPPAVPSIQLQDSGHEAWSAPPPSRPAPPPPVSSDSSQNASLVASADGELPDWDHQDEKHPSPVAQAMHLASVTGSPEMFEDQHAWDENQGQGLNQDDTAASHVRVPEYPVEQPEGWNIIDHEEPLSGIQQSGVIEANGKAVEWNGDEEHAPVLPPRQSEPAPAQQPRLLTDTTNESSSSIARPNLPSPTTLRQKKETYEIKKITWYDVTAAENPRISPILVQNANGPCPLMALVNALTLSTPSHVSTALVETLRSREQVSLGLLLDAVFDELMSGRRGDAAQELPDVGDLYSFLITLHTGMNVNPRFFPPPATNSTSDPRNSMSHIHPTKREAAIPGTFESTREMKLYSTFSVPLIHGWLPETNSRAYAALSRSAPSYEDAQNLMFHEEELEDKLQREGLSFEEQGRLEDIATINAFFSSAATQLTPFGLETITTSLAPGAIAILFRNDHFSTLYRHPDTLQLLQLVTDMGYAGHEEVVWESLTDVSGESAEFFSGDFRLVGGAPTTTSHGNEATGWTTVSGRQMSNLNQSQHQDRESSIPTPQSPNIEQEDHDLALALQLQEEEEERHRSELARRRRETELSQQYIEQQGNPVPANTVPVNNIPVNSRGGGRARNRGPSLGAPQLRPAISPRQAVATGQRVDPEAGVDAPPPSYEQAATQSPYVPPANHPAHPNASPNNQRRMSAYSANSASFSNGQTDPTAGRTAAGGRGYGRTNSFGRTGPTLLDQIPGRRQAAQGLGQQQQQPQDREKDCLVM